MATNPNAVLRFRESEMILNVTHLFLSNGEQEFLAPRHRRTGTVQQILPSPWPRKHGRLPLKGTNWHHTSTRTFIIPSHYQVSYYIT